MSKLLAPNGKPSNLTPEQYKLVRSKEFISWFGDWEKDPANASKVLDENGEPLVVYRGMPKKRRFGNIFNYNVNLFIENRKKNKFAFYFSRTKEEAEIYGFQSAEYNDDDYIVKEYFLKINNLFLAVKKDSVASKSKININSSRPNRFNLYDKPIPEIDKELGKGYLTFKELFDLAKPNKKDFELLNTEYTDNEDAKKEYEEEQERVSAKPIYWHFIDISKNDKKQDFWRNYLKDIKKYDGLMFYEDTHALTFTGRGKNEKAILQFLDNPNTICVFEPNQIKLADGTNTTFDGNNPDIRFDEGGSLEEIYYIPTDKSKEIITDFTHYKSGENYYPITQWANWFISQDRKSKEYIANSISNSNKLRNAFISNWYDDYKIKNNNLTFEEFLNKDIEVYRGQTSRDLKYGQSFGFDSYTTDKSLAEHFARDGNGLVIKKNVKPKETYGLIQSIGNEKEVMIPTKFSDEFLQKEWYDLSNKNMKIFDNLSDKDMTEFEELENSKNYQGLIDKLKDMLNIKLDNNFEKGGEVNIGLFSQIWGWFGIKF